MRSIRLLLTAVSPEFATQRWTLRLAVEGKVPVNFHGRMGGMIPSPDEIYEAFVKSINK